MPSALTLTAISLIITILIVRLMPPTTITKVVYVFVIVLALSTVAGSYLTTDQDGTDSGPKESKADKKERKKKIQKELKKMFWPKKAELMGRRRAPKVEVVEGGAGSYPDGEGELQT